MSASFAVALSSSGGAGKGSLLRGWCLTDAILGLEDLIVDLGILDLGRGLRLVLVIFATGAVPLAL